MNIVLMVSVGRRRTAGTHPGAYTAGRTAPIARQSVEDFALYIYLVQDTSAISGVSCLAPKSMRKMINIVNQFSKNFLMCPRDCFFEIC